MAGVRLERVTKRFGEVVAVDNVSIDIEDGSFVVLVGPSGCGKTTTLRLIAGLEELTEGNIYIDGKLVNYLAPKDRDIAMVFQNYALYPHMNVFDNMAFGLRLRRFPRDEIERRVRSAAAILGIEDLLHRKPRELSGGQRQRVAVGRAIVRDPKVFLFDEPLSNLDAKMRVQMRAELSRLHSRLGSTMIYVTHDQVEAMTMGDIIVVMKDGKVQQVADPITLYNQPENRFVAGFIGTPPMNFVDGIAEKRGRRVFVAGGDFSLPLSGEVAEKAQEYIGKKVSVGIRGEHFIFPGKAITGTVDIVEPMGSESYVYFTAGGVSFVAKVHSTVLLHPGEKVSFGIDYERVHLFDEDGKRIV